MVASDGITSPVLPIGSRPFDKGKMTAMKIIFLFQGEEVYRFELPAETETAVFAFLPSHIYSGIGKIPIPVITEIEFQQQTT